MFIEENQLNLNKNSGVLTCPIPILSPQLHSSLAKQEFCTHDKCENQQPLERAERFKAPQKHHYQLSSDLSGFLETSTTRTAFLWPVSEIIHCKQSSLRAFVKNNQG